MARLPTNVVAGDDVDDADDRGEARSHGDMQVPRSQPSALHEENVHGNTKTSAAGSTSLVLNPTQHSVSIVDIVDPRGEVFPVCPWLLGCIHRMCLDPSRG